MSVCPGNLRLQLMPFRRHDADRIATWVASPRELFHLAPSTRAPLTRQKVLDWPRPGGTPYTYGEAGRPIVAYGELNPMRNDALHYWLGHIVVAPELRGTGLGSRFLCELFDTAFTDFAARRISLVVFPENDAACRCYERVGMRCCGEEFHTFSTDGPRFRLLRYERTFQ